MKKLYRGRKEKIGREPGTLVHIGDQKTEKVTFGLMEYSADGRVRERELASVADLTSAHDPSTVSWIDVIGLHQTALVAAIGEAFDVHPLLLEDILNTDQRPKIEQQERIAYLVLKAIHWLPETAEVRPEQVSMVLGQHFVMTFQEQAGDVFDPVRQRIREGKGRIRKMGADYLAYALLDAVVDQYFEVLEAIGDRIDVLDEAVISDPRQETFHAIHHLKRELLLLRKSVWPLREVVGSLHRGDVALVQDTTIIYLRDVYEHVVQIAETIEAFRDVVVGLLEIYLSAVSNRMNEVMKVLTVVATLFIPLTFITSLYGMNFHYIPELQWRWGYAFVWSIMLVVSATMLVYFRRRKWL